MLIPGESIITSSPAIRSPDRTKQLKIRAAVMEFRRQQKATTLENRAETFDHYNGYIELLRTVHKNAAETMDWEKVLEEDPPVMPEFVRLQEGAALTNLVNFNPSFWGNLFGGAKKKMTELENEVKQARHRGNEAFAKAITTYRKKMAAWEKLQETGKAIFNKDITGYQYAIEYFSSFVEIGELGSSLDFEMKPNQVVANVQVNTWEVIPSYVVTPGSDGKLEKQPMPAIQFNELYREYVCSCILRVAKEILAYLPLEFVLVNVVGIQCAAQPGKPGNN